MRVYLTQFLSLILFTSIFYCGGCAVSTPPTVTEDVDRSTQAAQAVRQKQRAPSVMVDAERPVSATQALLHDANLAIEQKQYARASSLAERALRMQPKDGEPYFVLAKSYYFQQQLDLARSFLARARSLAAGNAELMQSIASFAQRHGGL